MLKPVFISAFMFSCILSFGQVSGSGYIKIDDDSIFYEVMENHLLRLVLILIWMI